MTKTIELAPPEQQRLEEIMKQFHEELSKRPEISDEEFMAEFEVSDEQYQIGMAIAVPVTDKGGVDE